MPKSEFINQRVAMEKLDYLSLSRSDAKSYISIGDRLLHRLIDEINDRIDDPTLSVEDLASCVAMHKKTLTRTLKKTIGLTPGKLIQTVRLEQALIYLEAKCYSTVREVAFAIGYASPSKFSYSFEKRYGRKPSEFID